jgi:acyl-CoA thioesterase FadM
LRRPDWREIVTAKTFPIDNAGMRTHVNTEILDKNGKQLLLANQEACVLSLENHRPQKLTDLPYPKENFPSPVYTEAFERFPSDFREEEFVFEQIIRSCHIDMSHHMNNIEYIKLALCVFNDDFLQTHEITDIEVHYTGESREGQTLRVFRRDDENGGKTFIHIKESGRCVFECCICHK